MRAHSGTLRVFNLHCLTADARETGHRAVADTVGALARSYLLHSPERIATSTILLDRPLVASFNSESSLSSGLPNLSNVWSGRESSPEPDQITDVSEDFDGLELLASVGDIGALSRITGHSPVAVARMLSEIQRQTGLGRIFELIRRQPARDRLTVWQGQAMIDDGSVWRRRMALELLGSGPRATEDLSSWLTDRRQEIERAAGLIDHGETSSNPLAAAHLALRTLIRSTPSQHGYGLTPLDESA